MSAIKRKAKAGVTLVELLVVILIVTILSVSMLPLLKPFVVQSQYAAEPIPVIGNLRTKVGLYQYDKTTLPCSELAGTTGEITAPKTETWMLEDPESKPDVYDQATITYGSDEVIKVDDNGKAESGVDKYTPPTDFTAKNKHFGLLCDIDYQELKGKRSRPNHYQYLVMKNGSSAYAYFLGCFGNGVGLPKCTGYAVCEIVTSGHKYVGTWERYKPVGSSADDKEGQITFTSSFAKPATDPDETHTFGCYVPGATEFDNVSDDESAKTLVNLMARYGWKF